jgi:hypothetical protein
LKVFHDTYWQDNGFRSTKESKKVFIKGLLDIANTSLSMFISDNAALERIIKNELKPRLDLILLGQSQLDDIDSDDNRQEIINAFTDVIGNIPIKQIQLAALTIKIINYLFTYSNAIANSNVNTTELSGTTNFKWTKIDNKSMVHNDPISIDDEVISLTEAYTQSIAASNYGLFESNLDELRGGYSLSRLNNGFDNRVYIPGETLLSQVESASKVYNGDFSMSYQHFFSTLFYLPGWSHHGGEFISTPGIIISDEKLMIGPIGVNDGFTLWHDRLLLSSNASILEFELRINSIGINESGFLKVKFKSDKETVERKIPFDLTKSSSTNVKVPIPVNMQNEVISYGLDFEGFGVDIFPPIFVMDDFVIR